MPGSFPSCNNGMGRLTHYQGIHNFGRPNRPINPTFYSSATCLLVTSQEPITKECQAPNGSSIKIKVIHDEHAHVVKWTVLANSSERYKKLTQMIETANVNVPFPPDGNIYTNAFGAIRELPIDVNSVVMGQGTDSEDKILCFFYATAKTKKSCDTVSEILTHHIIRYEEFAAMQVFDNVNKERLIAFFQNLCNTFS